MSSNSPILTSFDVRQPEGDGGKKLPITEPVRQAFQDALGITGKLSAVGEGIAAVELKTDQLQDAMSQTVSQTDLNGEAAQREAADTAERQERIGAVSTMNSAITTLQTDSATQTTNISTLSGRVAGLEVGNSFDVAAKADLPAGVNATGKTRYAMVNADPAGELNGRYYQNNGSAAWSKVAGDPFARIATVEMTAAANTQVLSGMVNLPLASPWLAAIVLSGGRENGEADVLLGVNEDGETDFIPTQEAADASFARIGDDKLEAIGGKLFPRVENGWMEFADGVKLTWIPDSEVPGAPPVIIVDRDGGWDFLPGTAAGGGSTANGLLPRTSISETFGSIIAFHGYGQSNIIGADGRPLLSTSQTYGNLSFGVGPRAGLSDLGGLGPLVETAIDPAPDGDTGRGETFCSGMANGVGRQWLADMPVADFPFRFFGSTAGKGGTGIVNLGPDKPWYPLLPAHMTATRYLLNAQGHSVTCPVLIWDQGETDVRTDAGDTSFLTREEYRVTFTALIDRMCADTRAIYGQDFDPKIFVVMVGFGSTVYSDIVLAQWDMRHDPRVILVMGDYFLPSPTGLHRDAAGHRLMGYYLSYAFKLYFLDRLDFKATQPVRGSCQARTIRLEFAACQFPLELDDSLIAGVPDHGIQVTDTVGVHTIASMRVAGGRWLEITVTRDIAANCRVTGGIAYHRPLAGRTAGCLGLRDSTEVVIDGNIMRQWGLPFEIFVN